MVSMKLLNIISCIIILEVANVVDSYDLKYEITHRNKCLVSDMIVMHFVRISLKQCVRECAVHQSCLSVSYERKHLLCELYSVDDGTFVDNGSGTGPCVFVRKTSIVPQIPAACSCSELEACDVESLSCNTKLCPKLELDHGVVNGNMRTIGAAVTYSCKNNYAEAQGRTQSTCEQSGSWSYMPQCIIVCPELKLDHGVVNGNMRTIGATITYSCKNNYVEAQGRTQSTCEQSGSWSYMPQCIIASCSKRPVTDFSKYNNVALNKTVKLSSVLNDYKGSLMVDGNRDVIMPHCAHTTMNLPKYAELDLGQSLTIYALFIVNRAENFSDRLRNVSLSIGESRDSMKLHVYHKDPIGATCTFVLVPPCRGRYIKVVNDENKYLTICELEVYGE